MPPARKPKKTESYTFAIVKNYPQYKTFEIIKHPEGSFASIFMKTLSQLFKGE